MFLGFSLSLDLQISSFKNTLPKSLRLCLNILNDYIILSTSNLPIFRKQLVLFLIRQFFSFFNPVISRQFCSSPFFSLFSFNLLFMLFLRPSRRPAKIQKLSVVPEKAEKLPHDKNKKVWKIPSPETRN